MQTGKLLLVITCFTILSMGLNACSPNVPPNPSPTTEVLEVPLSQQNIIKQLVLLGQFKTLIRLIDAAGLQGDLQQDGPFTLLAPLDTAFGNLPKGTVNQLLAEPNVLAQLLNGHVVWGDYSMDELVNMSPVTALDGSEWQVQFRDGYFMVNGAKVLLADLEASNGRIHIMDALVNGPQVEE